MISEQKPPNTQNLSNTSLQTKLTEDRFNEIAGIIGHEMREDVRIILGFIDLLEDRYSAELDDDFKKFIFYIVEYSEKLKYLAERVLVICENREKD